MAGGTVVPGDRLRRPERSRLLEGPKSRLAHGGVSNASTLQSASSRAPRWPGAEPQRARAREIQRLIGRGLRAAVDLERLGERTIAIDCDILEADGGTRTASVTAGFVALALALENLRKSKDPSKKLDVRAIRDQVAAVSVGHVDGAYALDLCYAEDSHSARRP